MLQIRVLIGAAVNHLDANRQAERLNGPVCTLYWRAGAEERTNKVSDPYPGEIPTRKLFLRSGSRINFLCGRGDHSIVGRNWSIKKESTQRRGSNCYLIFYFHNL